MVTPALRGDPQADRGKRPADLTPLRAGLMRPGAGAQLGGTRPVPMTFRELPMPSAPASAFRGNKSALPRKPCAACARPMTWRKRWRSTWDAVKYCSEACRRGRGAA